MIKAVFFVHWDLSLKAGRVGSTSTVETQFASLYPVGKTRAIKGVLCIDTFQTRMKQVPYCCNHQVRGGSDTLDELEDIVRFHSLMDTSFWDTQVCATLQGHLFHSRAAFTNQYFKNNRAALLDHGFHSLCCTNENSFLIVPTMEREAVNTTTAANIRECGLKSIDFTIHRSREFTIEWEITLKHSASKPVVLHLCIRCMACLISSLATYCLECGRNWI